MDMNTLGISFVFIRNFRVFKIISEVGITSFGPEIAALLIRQRGRAIFNNSTCTERSLFRVSCEFEFRLRFWQCHVLAVLCIRNVRGLWLLKTFDRIVLAVFLVLVKFHANILHLRCKRYLFLNPLGFIISVGKNESCVSRTVDGPDVMSLSLRLTSLPSVPMR